MDEPLVRWIVVGAAVVVALGVAWTFRRLERRRAGRTPLDLTPLARAVTLFSDADCANCDRARAALIERGVDFEEFRFDHHPQVLAAVGVTGVPLIVARAADGSEIGRIAGRVRRRDLERLLARVASGA